MYKSIEETTAKLKSLNFVLIFESKKTKNKINIQFNNKTISSRTDISITDIGQKVNLKFSGFVPNDPEQKILCFLLLSLSSGAIPWPLQVHWPKIALPSKANLDVPHPLSLAA